VGGEAEVVEVAEIIRYLGVLSRQLGKDSVEIWQRLPCLHGVFANLSVAQLSVNRLNADPPALHRHTRYHAV
jgi:hypothetical protein